MKRKFYTSLGALAFAGVLYLYPPTLYAQTFAVHRQVNTQGDSKKTVKLRDVLLQLQSQYQVDILFEEKLLEQLTIDANMVNTNVNIERNLTNLLKESGLQYRKIKKNAYLITLPKEAKDENKVGFQEEFPVESGFAMNSASTANETAKLGENASVPAAVQVSGRVTDDQGQGLPGVSILLKGTTTGTATDVNGGYNLTVPDGNGTLVFSFIGYTSKEEPINNRTTINIVLATDVKALEEVVVVGYGTQRKQDVTGSISSIKADDLRTQGSNTIQKSLQGRVAGVQVESAGGDPGSGVRILVRGTGSLTNNNPLYIVDGVQVDNINNLSPTDIASMDILKDASAAAIYGSRAANGVVLITTKSGKKGENRIDFNAYYGLQQVTKTIDVLNASEWARVSNAAHENAGLPKLDLANNPDALGAGTDWQKEIYRVAPMQNYTLGVSGGSENYTYSISGGYLGQDGIVKETGYNRLNLRIKSDFTKGRIKIGESIILSKEYWRNMAGGWGGQGGNAVGSAAKMIPVFNVYDPTAVGGYGGAYGPVVNIANPVAQLNLENPEVNSTTAIINAFAELSLIKGMKYRFNVGYTTSFGHNETYTAPYKVGALFQNTDADLYERRNQNDYFLQEHTLAYDKSFGKHAIQALVGFTYQNTQYRELSGWKSGMPNGIQVIDAGIANTATGGNARESALVSYLGRLVYSYNDRYVFTTTFRRDGSSRFGPKNKYGNYPSVALAWNASNESFFESLRPIVSSLKVRASYGVLGNQEIPNYKYIPSISSNINYVIGENQQLWPGAVQTAFANPNIKWETSKTVNVGADFGFFDDKLSLSADYFVRQNKDILLAVPIPLSTGASSQSPYINAGQITNKGVELALAYNNSVGDFKYQLTGTFTAIDNNVDNLGSGTQQITGGQPTHHGAAATITQAGLPVGSFYLIKTAGIFNSDAEVSEYSKNGQLIQPAAKAGDIKFVDANNDGKIDQNDRQYCGSPNPNFSYGFGANASWKGLDVNMFFQGTQGNKIYNGLRQDLEGMNLEFNYAKSTLNAWTPQNTNTDIPRAVINDPNLNSQTSDRFLESGSYLRLRTLQVGYTIPKAIMTLAKITSLRVYLSFDNLFTITKYKGFNPDLGRYNPTGTATNNGQGILDRGVDFPHVAYPLARTSMLGLQLSF